MKDKLMKENISQWTKRLDVMHYVNRDEHKSISTTLCGKYMLGNNYAEENQDREDCKECSNKLKEMEQ